jgi:hypothetical protein
MDVYVYINIGRWGCDYLFQVVIFLIQEIEK